MYLLYYCNSTNTGAEAGTKGRILTQKLQEEEATQSTYGCIKEDGVLGCVAMGRRLKEAPFPFPTTDEGKTRWFEAQVADRLFKSRCVIWPWMARSYELEAQFLCSSYGIA